MYCPNCKVEYREGFTICSDCNKELVQEISCDIVENQNTESILWKSVLKQIILIFINS